MDFMGQETRRVARRSMAEFVVIVVGVLVAFGVQDWADRRSHRQVEALYLERLAEDVRADSALYADRFIPNLAFSDSILRLTQPVARGVAPFPADTISFLADLSMTHHTPFLWILGEVYEELLSTGSLTLIESPDLRSAVVSYYSFKRVAGARAESRASTYPQLIRAYLPEDLLMSRDYPSDEDVEKMLRSYGALEAAELVRTADFGRALNQHLAYLAIMRATTAELLVETEQLLPQIEEALADLR
jgi:hypothetical protein